MIGQTISHYKILSKLGEGGMGIVYKAQDLKLPRFVALKFLTTTLGAEREKKRFIHEAEAASSLDHPNICGIYEIDETPEGQMFIAMPCYEGESLQAKIDRGPLKLDEAVDITIQVASGLAKAHEKGIVHRDIKPGNIFMTTDGLAKIVDFGLAKLATQTKLTRSGATVGTVTYMSPEQARGDEVDRRSDIWSLGVMLYEMVTGRVPFRGDHEPAVVYSIMNEAAEPVTAVRTGVPMELERVIDKCMAKKPDERYQHADELIVDLKKIRNDLVAERDTPRSRSFEAPSWSGRKKFWIPTILVAALALAFFFLRPSIFGESPIAAPKPIAVISFENQTGDASYDYLREVIPNLLITRLEQSKYLSVVTWERLHDLLNRRGNGDVKLIDKELGFELCQMDGIDTIVLGSFSKAGDVFVTDVKVLDVRSKELLKGASAKGGGVGSILASQIDDLGREISRGIGLSERSIVADGRPIAEVTTRSMDAYHYFLRGRDEFYAFYDSDARRSLEKAVGLDSTFAVAWLYLGRTYRHLGDINLADDAYARANRLAASAPEKDRLYIEAMYAQTVERDGRKYEDLLRELTRKYPREKLAHLEMGICYHQLGRWDEAVKSFEKALSLDPEYGDALNVLAYAYAGLYDYPKAIEYLERYAAVSPGDVNPIDSMADMCFRMGDLGKAVELYKKTLDIRPGVGSESPIAYIAALQEDYDGAIAWCDRSIDAAPSQGLKGRGRFMQSFIYWMALRDGEALGALGTARPMLETVGQTFSLGETWFLESWVRYHLREYETARECLEKSISVMEPANMWGPCLQAEFAFVFGLIDLQEGRVDQAKERLDQMHALYPEVTDSEPACSPLPLYHSVLLEGEILLAEGRIDDAIMVCRQPPDVGLHVPPIRSSGLFHYNLPAQRDVLARAYVAKGSIDQAIAEYERLVTFDPKSRNRRLIYPLFHYRLARLYEEKGREPEAAREYEKFLEICKGAGEQMAELSDARSRLQRLATANRR